MSELRVVDDVPVGGGLADAIAELRSVTVSSDASETARAQILDFVDRHDDPQTLRSLCSNDALHSVEGWSSTLS